MSRYRPATPFTSPVYILTPTYQIVKGTRKKVYPDPNSLGDENLIFGTFRSFGGTDTVVNDVVTVEATGYLETWYRPDITSQCRLYFAQTEDTYEILGDPENIELRNQYMKIRVKRIGGAA